MAESAVRLPVSGGAVDARILDGPQGLAVLAHPHPHYGGNMDNNVVLAARDALREVGVGTLRFNFRGGDPDPSDLAEVLGHASSRVEGAPIHLAAYSYGAWIALQTLQTPQPVASLLLFSPPVDFLSFDDWTLPNVRCRVVVGDRDSYCSRAGLQAWLSEQPVEVDLQYLPDTDHFYWGSEDALARLVREFIEPLL